MKLLEGYRVSFDSWRVIDEYTVEESLEIGDTDVETKDWRPLDGLEAPDLLLAFVDGVRRTENLIYLEDEEGGFWRGAFVSVGAGCVLIRLGRSNRASESYRAMTVKRYLLLEKGVPVDASSVKLTFGEYSLDFEVDKTDKEFSARINELMTSLERKVALNVFKKEKPDLLVTDGSLHYSAKVKRLPFVGYVKKHMRVYLPPERRDIFREMKVGQRTPLFLIHSQPTMEGKGPTSFDKFSWYVRISEHEGLSGLARLEVSAGIGKEEAIRIADITAWLMPKLASTEFTDARAPQNLLPIKHLENTLRKRLGSQSLIRRLISKELQL